MRFIQSNGIKVRIAEMGSGPLVILLHGFPESWYSWRHQLPALAKAGFQALAPDLRGYGKSDKPEKVEDYDIQHLTADVVGIEDAHARRPRSPIRSGAREGGSPGWARPRSCRPGSPKPISTTT